MKSKYDGRLSRAAISACSMPNPAGPWHYDPGALREVFAKIGFKPALMRDIVKGMSAEGITDVVDGLEHYMTGDHQVAIWLALLHSVDAFEQGVLRAVANGLPPLSQATLEMLAAIPGAKPTISKVRTAIERLRRKGLLSKVESGAAIDDPLFAAFLRQRRTTLKS